MARSANITWEREQSCLRLMGDWLCTTLGKLPATLDKLSFPRHTSFMVDASSIEKLDTAGAWMMHRYFSQLKAFNYSFEVQGLNPTHQLLLDRIEAQSSHIRVPEHPQSPPLLPFIGREFVQKVLHFLEFHSFIGLALATFKQWFKPKNIQWNSILKMIEETGCKALPIIGLLSFLIGIVLAYQMGLQLRDYSANAYIVDFSGLAILREFGPLITAIIVAGRTGSAFTAQIGIMKINEEIDALRTFGLSPVERLVLPRIFGLLVAIPLLTVWADAFGIMGCMFMANHMLDISYMDFLKRFQEVVPLKTYTLGLIKTPVFAVLIAQVGCFQGFQVAYSADSVGSQTTRSVVQSIFLIIITDAFFSVLYSWQGL
ncbi:MAG: ABC transporter permease [Proteobacteria bacterium]|nr:ABC transporter permease [Pseudomonadota bacterium]